MTTTLTTPSPVYTCATCGVRIYPDKRTKRLQIGFISNKPVCNPHYQQEIDIELKMYDYQFNYEDWGD